jgi:hypothetical protein
MLLTTSLKTFVENQGRPGMMQRTPKTVYVNPQQLQRQREHKDEARKSIVLNADPARVLAKAWRIGKLATSPAAATYTKGR